MFLLCQSHTPSLIRAGGVGDLSTEERDAVRALQEILQTRGVPEASTEERALMGLSRIGLGKIQEALRSRDAWAALKAAGSAPRINFLWLKPMELEAQIKRRAQSKFRINPSSKKSSRGGGGPGQPPVVDPQDLQLIAGTFVTEDGEPVTQLPISDVGSNRTGLAFGLLAQAQPFLQGTESLTLGGLAILTTSTIHQECQGLLPVTNLRFPALFVPTGEPVLIEGSLIQLGDKTIQRTQDVEAFQLEEISTTVIKVSVFKDQWPSSWDDFCKAPVKELLHRMPLFLLCKGNKCGEACRRFHAPVDCEIDSVVTDVWSRMWLTLRGKKTSADQSDLFQVLLRIPEVCLKPLHWLSGIDGMYVEPRTTDGRASDPTMVVIWLPGVSFEEVQHRQKTTDRTLPIVRFGWKYGIRVFTKDSDQLQTKLGAEEAPQQVQIHRIYEIRPFPHGTQKKVVQQFLQQMQWQAKAIQPGRSDAAGMVWKVGSEHAPPTLVVPTSRGDVTITLQKQVAAGPPLQRVFGSSKTQAHLRQQSKERSKAVKTIPSGDKENTPPYASTSKGTDPWLLQQQDPWRRYSGSSTSAEDTPMQVTPKLDSIEERLRGEITTVVQQATDTRMSRMEVDLQELKHQQVKFESWCHEAGQANVQLQSQLHQLAATVSEHSSELTDMGK
eukprot:s191_g27.t1